MNNYVNVEHVHRLILDNGLEVLPEVISQKAAYHLKRRFPLQSRVTTSIIDWTQVPSTAINWMNLTDDAAAAWAAGTTAGRCTFGILLFDSDGPCLFGHFNVLFRHLDELLWKAPGCRLLFGVEQDSLGEIIFSDGIIEYDGKSELFASITP